MPFSIFSILIVATLNGKTLVVCMQQRQVFLDLSPNTVKPVLSGLSKRPKICFQGRLLLYAGQKYCRMLQESILQYFRPSLSYHLSLRSLFCLFLRGRLRQVLLYCSYFEENHSYKGMLE